MKQLNKTQNAVGLMILFCIVILLLRVQITQSLFFSFLLWNIFLAIIPYGISEWMKKVKLSKVKLLLFTTCWLLFLPNAPYIITDFIHLLHLKSTMVWYDLFMIFCFANTGLILTIITMNDLYKMIQKSWTTKIANQFIIIVTFLCGFGIHLGRFLRLNSWNIITSPVNTLKISFLSFNHQKTWFISLGFGGFLWILFSVFRGFIEHQKETKNYS